MKTSNSQRAHTLDDAISLHKAGRISEAARSYVAFLVEDPDNADILGLMGLAQYQLGNRNAAKTAWHKSLTLPSAPPIVIRNMNNFLTALVQEGTEKDPPLFAELAIPDWPSGLVPSQSEKDSIISLARGFMRIGRKPAAQKLLESVLSQIADDAKFIRDAAEIMYRAGHTERANLLLEQLPPAEGEANGALLILQAAAAFAAGKREDAVVFTAKAIEALPVHMTTKAASQSLLIGVLNTAPVVIDKNMSPQLLHFSNNSPASLAWKYNEAYRFMSIFPDSPTVKTAMEKLPKPDLILNNWVNAETLNTPRTLQFISEFADSLGLPILNHPRHAAATTRQRNAELLAGIPNLTVPRIARFFNEPAKRNSLIRGIGDTIGFPVIVRDPFAQMGKEAAKLDTPRQLDDYLNRVRGQELYAIEFIHNPLANGIYRKFRAAVIGEEIIIYHCHFGERWNVHRERDQDKRAAISIEPALFQFSEKIIANPSEGLGEPGIAALQEIRRRIPLEFFGIDFDILRDGKLLFFEANAAMNISLSGQNQLQTPRVIMRDALRRLFESRKYNGQHNT